MSKIIIVALLFVSYSTLAQVEHSYFFSLVDSAIDKLSNDNIHNKELKTKYTGTNLINGYEIDYYYTDKITKNCWNFRFFVTRIDELKKSHSLLNAFKNMSLGQYSFIKYQMGNNVSANIYTERDTFSYSEDMNKYEYENFRKWEISDSAWFYHLNEQEKIIIYAIKAVADTYTGDKDMICYFQPFTKIDQIKRRDYFLQYMYRNTLSKENIHFPSLLRAKPVYEKKVKCGIIHK